MRLASSKHLFAVVMALTSCASSTLGLCVGSLFPQGDSALAVGPALMVVYVILGSIGPAGAGELVSSHTIIRNINDTTTAVSVIQ